MKLLPFTPDHAQDFFELTQDPAFTSFLITDYRQVDVASALKWIEANQRLMSETGLGKWGVWLNDQLIGMGGLTPWAHGGRALVDVTYRLHGRVHGQGLGRKLAELVVHKGVHEFKLTNLSATITPDNVPSIRLIESLGFVFHSEIILHNVKTWLYLKSTQDH